MKFRNVSLFIILAFCLSLIVFSFCRQGEEEQKGFVYKWNIPSSILARYTDQEIEDTKGRLQTLIEELWNEVEKNYRNKNYSDIGELLSSHQTAFYKSETETLIGKNPISGLFEENGGRTLTVGSEIHIHCIDMMRPGVTGSGIDFLAVIRFSTEFGSTSDSGPEDQDPPGDTIYFHRKVCTWI